MTDHGQLKIHRVEGELQGTGPEHSPDVVVLGLDPGHETAQGKIVRAHQLWPEAAIILKGAPGDPHCLLTAVRHGVRGVILPESAPDEVDEAARKVHAGELWFSRSQLKAMLGIAMFEQHLWGLRDMAESSGLTERELEVSELVVRGFSNRQIAERLGIAESTAKVHLHHAFGKLHVASRAELLVKTTVAGPPDGPWC